MARRIKYIIFFTFIFVVNNLYAAKVDSIRLWRAPDNTRVVFDLDSPAEYKDFILDNPKRLVIDIDKSKLKSKNILNEIDWSDTDIAQLRYSTNSKYLRMVFDLKKAIKYKVFVLPPNGIIYGHRIVVDIDNTTSGVVAQKQNLPKLTSLDYARDKKFTVVIDPGHGGEDPGAVGRRGTQEKEVVLQIAKYLKQYIDQDKTMNAVLTRDRDYYIGLRDRTEKARANQSDLFVSIHADGFRDRRAKGASVFVLSERGASSELAKWMADNENASDLVGGVSLENKDAMLATVLLDLSQTASNRLSYQVANTILEEVSKVSSLHKSQVEKAGFVVLKSPDIPSVLVETGFISNPTGELNLRSSAYQRKMAYSIYKGIKQFFKTQPRPSFDQGIMQASK